MKNKHTSKTCLTAFENCVDCSLGLQLHKDLNYEQMHLIGNGGQYMDNMRIIFSSHLFSLLAALET